MARRRQSSDDLFGSDDDTDSDATVDLSVSLTNHSKPPCINSATVIIDSDSDLDVSPAAKTDNKMKKSEATFTTENSKSRGVQRRINSAKKHAISSSDSETEVSHAVAKPVSSEKTAISQPCLNIKTDSPRKSGIKRKSSDRSPDPSVADLPSTSGKNPQISTSGCLAAGTDRRPLCRYGEKCYRKNPDHLKEFQHPGSFSELPTCDPVVPSPKRSCSDNPTVSRSLAAISKPLSVDQQGSTSRSTVCDYETFSFKLTKVEGITPKFNNPAAAVSIKDLLSVSMGNLQRSAQFNYCIDIEWLLSQYPPQFRSLPLLIVHGDKKDEKADLDAVAMSHNNISMCQAQLDIAYGTHHTKMMLLLYETGLRVVIHTANLVEGDWAKKTQGVWMSPLFPPLSSPGGDTVGDSSTNFKRDLLQYLAVYRNKHVTEWMDIIRKHDLSAARVYVIGSVPGRHVGESKNQFGHMKLRKILSTCGPEADSVAGWSVVGQFSSIGSLGASADNWLCGELLDSLSATSRTTPSVKSKPKLQLVYPSVDNVRNSLEGYLAGGALPYSIHVASKQPWLNGFLHQWKSRCQGRSWASPHIKTYLRASPDASKLAWFLVTSANLSKAAWGCFEKNATQLMIRSYELGVLYLPSQFEQCGNCFTTRWQQTSSISSAPIFPVPYDLPLTPYAKEDRPWIWDISYKDQPDSHGCQWSPS